MPGQFDKRKAKGEKNFRLETIINCKHVLFVARINGIMFANK